ncbi:MAG: hypothetical protein KGN79_07685 [Acidobacteriota bacterium]|nr:hypothetical protein [Acidobacteriota bacterium]
MAEPVDTNQNPSSEEPQSPPESWMKMGTVAALSALAGGLAAAWYYRRTLNKLREAEDVPLPDAPFDPDEDEF